MNNININRMGVLQNAPTFLAIIFALTFTLSCSSDDGDDNTTGGTSSGLEESSSSSEKPESSSSSEMKISSSSDPGNSSSSGGDSLSSSSGGDSSSSSVSKTNVLVDSRDSKEYKIVKIGNQTWMAENLNFGTPNGSYCYNNDNSNCEKYGRLYNWTAAMNACPVGWHLPSDAEWTTLRLAVGGTGTYGTDGAAGTKLKATSGWNNNGNGTDDYGFSALPGGRGRSSSNFDLAGSDGGWWSASETNTSEVWNMSMNYGRETAGRYGNNKTYFQSVRCVRDSEEVPLSSSSSSEITIESCSNIEYGTNSFTCGGQTYKTVVIGTQTWMAENLNWETGESWCYNNEDSNCETYGRLYNWATAMALPASCNSSLCESQVNTPHRGICPDGFHIPTDANWNELFIFLDGTLTGSTNLNNNYTSLRAGTMLKASTGWESYTGVPAGIGDNGFAALPGGDRNSGGAFNRIGRNGDWWSSNENSAGIARSRVIYHNSEGAAWSTNIKSYGSSVRCIKD